MPGELSAVVEGDVTPQTRIKALEDRHGDGGSLSGPFSSDAGSKGHMDFPLMQHQNSPCALTYE